MTTPTPPAKAPGKKPTAIRRDPTKDALSDLPPMPKTKPVKVDPPAPKPKPAAGADGEPATVTKKELFTRVKARTGKIKGHEVRAVMDALLDEMGAALVKGETLKVPALGTMKVQRRKPQAKADVVVCKLNRKKPATKVKDPLAKPPKGS